MTELWAKPGERDWTGDIMTQECFDDIINRTSSDTQVWLASIHEGDSNLVGKYTDVLNANWQNVGLVLAPDCEVLDYDIIKKEDGSADYMLYKKVGEFFWCLQRDPNFVDGLDYRNQSRVAS